MLLAEAAVLPANMKRDVWSLDDYDVHKELSTGYASYVYYVSPYVMHVCMHERYAMPTATELWQPCCFLQDNT